MTLHFLGGSCLVIAQLAGPLLSPAGHPPRHTAILVTSHEFDPIPAEKPSFSTPIFHTVLLFTTMRVTEAYLWPHPFADTNWERIGKRYRDTFTKPPIFALDRRAFEWDGDRFSINFLGHGLLGSELYLRARNCRFGVAGSLAFAALSSTTWEYVFEGNGVRPSALDLVWTPLAGLLLGELRFQLHQAAGKVSNRFARSFLRTVVDPFGELERSTITTC